MKDKQFKNLDEQIEIFKSKGLVINDVKYAKSVLLREKYFILKGYRHDLLKKDNKKEY